MSCSRRVLPGRPQSGLGFGMVIVEDVALTVGRDNDLLASRQVDPYTWVKPLLFAPSAGKSVVCSLTVLATHEAQTKYIAWQMFRQIGDDQIY